MQQQTPDKVKTHNTNDELVFISGLGKHSAKKLGGRLKLLGLYREACLKRQVWGDIDPVHVLDHVRDEIKKEIAK